MENVHFIQTETSLAKLQFDRDYGTLKILDEPCIVNGQDFVGANLNITANYGTNESDVIIMTTNPSLINKGVQEIPDEFLRWYIQNSSCDRVEIEIIQTKAYIPKMIYSEHPSNIDECFSYKIIMPKEEPKYPIGGYAPGYYMCNCSTCKKQFQGDKRAVQCEPCAIEMIKEEPKQELEAEYKYQKAKFDRENQIK